LLQAILDDLGKIIQRCKELPEIRLGRRADVDGFVLPNDFDDTVGLSREACHMVDDNLQARTALDLFDNRLQGRKRNIWRAAPTWRDSIRRYGPGLDPEFLLECVNSIRELTYSATCDGRLGRTRNGQSLSRSRNSLKSNHLATRFYSFPMPPLNRF